MNKISDEDLFNNIRLNINEKECFNELYKRHNLLLFGVSYKYTNDEETAKSIVNDTFLKLKEEKTDLNNVIAWLYVVLRNKCHDTSRQKRRSIQTVPLELESEDEKDLYENNDAFFVQNDLLQRLIDRETLEQLISSLQTSILQNVARLRFIDGYSYAYIAENLSIDITTVRNAIVQVRRLSLNQKPRT